MFNHLGTTKLREDSVQLVSFISDLRRGAHLARQLGSKWWLCCISVSFHCCRNRNLLTRMLNVREVEMKRPINLTKYRESSYVRCTS